MIGEMLFALIFTVHGREYVLLDSASIYTCVARMQRERTAITEVSSLHPELSMTVSCQPLGLGRKEYSMRYPAPLVNSQLLSLTNNTHRLFSRGGPMDIVISGTIAYKVTLHCRYCSKPFFSRHRVELANTNIDHIRRSVQNDFRQRTPDIPGSWSMSGRENISCPSCQHKG